MQSKMRNIRYAATYLKEVRRLAMEGACKKGEMLYEAYRVRRGRRFLKPNTLPPKQRKQINTTVMELGALRYQFDDICPYHTMRGPLEYRARTAEAVDNFWTPLQWKDCDEFQRRVSYAVEAERVAQAAEADLFFLHDHVFAPEMALLCDSADARQCKELAKYAQSGKLDLLFLSDTDCWLAASKLDTPHKRMMLMDLHHASQAKVYMDRIIKEKAERRLAVAMALHSRLGGASALGALSSCLVSKMLSDFGL
jgi:hypothetical protein